MLLNKEKDQINQVTIRNDFEHIGPFSYKESDLEHFWVVRNYNKATPLNLVDLQKYLHLN